MCVRLPTLRRRRWWRFLGNGGGWPGLTNRAGELEQFGWGIEQIEQQQ